MSLHPQPLSAIPEETQRVAHAAFPKGPLGLRIADELGDLFRDPQFADLFPTRGQPAASPARLAWVCVLQYIEGLSDRQAADAGVPIAAEKNPTIFRMTVVHSHTRKRW